MRVPRVVEAGRWESVALTHPELARFTDRYGELFEEDARAQLWVGELDGVGMLVLDEHDLIYAYGPLHTLRAGAPRARLRAGRPAGAGAARAPLQPRSTTSSSSDLRRLWAWNRILPAGHASRRTDAGWRLEQDLGRGLVRAAGEHELDGAMQIGLGVRDLLGERQRVAGLDEHVQPPGLDLFAF